MQEDEDGDGGGDDDDDDLPVRKYTIKYPWKLWLHAMQMKIPDNNASLWLN